MGKSKATRIESPPSELIQAINDKKCVVFVGAGLSQGAGYPSWPQLLKKLTDRCEREGTPASRVKAIRSLISSNDTIKYLMAAEDLRDCIGPDKFVGLLADEFQDDSMVPTAAHEQLPKIGFRGAITTNYDKLIEYTYAKARAGRTPPTYTSNDAADLADALFKERFFILKAHGDIEKRSTLVLTEKDYRDVFYRRPGYKTALSTIFTTRSVLFLGASLADPEMWLLLGYLHDCFHGSGTYHYALLPNGDEAETMFNRWKNDFQVNCIHYDASADHREVAEFLKSLPQT
jgi:hypothetical protein